MNRPQSNGLYTHPNMHVRVDSGRPVASSWLNGQGALVFGGATGAGAAVVRALAEAGAYVTIADSGANEGQRLMLECVARNLRLFGYTSGPVPPQVPAEEDQDVELRASSVQYIYTNLPVFRSQAEAMHYAAVFSPTATVSVIVCSAVPPPTTPQSPHLSLLSWLRTTTTDSVFPNPIPVPATTPLDRAVTATYHAVHHALHHFRQSPPLIPLQQQRGRQQSLHQNAVSTSPKSATSSTRSHVANLSPTSFKTAGTSTSASAPPSHAPPPPPPPALPLDPSTALHAHPVRCRENGETSTSPTVPTGPVGALTLPGLPSSVMPPGTGAEEDLTALPMALPPPSPSSPAGVLDESMHTLTLMATLPPNERKHLVVVAPDAYLNDEDVDGRTPIDSNDSASIYDVSDGPVNGARRSKNKLPPQLLAERAAAAGLRALVDGLTELCDVDAVGPGISVGCVGWGDDRPEELGKNGHGDDEDGDEALLANSADRRCVRGVMRLLCGNVENTTAARAVDNDIDNNDSSAAMLLGSSTRTTPAAGARNVALPNLSPSLPPLSIPLSNPNPSPTLLSAASTTDVEADADDEASGDFDADDALDDDAVLVEADSSSSSTSNDLILAARSVAPSPLDRPSPSAAARGSAPALGQLREEDDEEDDEESGRERKGGGDEGKGVSALPPLASTLPGPGKQGDNKDDDDDNDRAGAGRATAAEPSNPQPQPQPQDKPAHQPTSYPTLKPAQPALVSPSLTTTTTAADTPAPARPSLSISLSDADTTKPLPPLPAPTTPPPSRADDLTEFIGDAGAGAVEEKDGKEKEERNGKEKEKESERTESDKDNANAKEKGKEKERDGMRKEQQKEGLGREDEGARASTESETF